VVERFVGARPRVTVIRHTVNHGKGEAIQTGMETTRGRLRLFADADGATPIEEERRLRLAIEAGADAAIGSRAARRIRGSGGWLPPGSLENGPVGPVRWNVKFHRYLMGRTFATLTRGVLGLGYADTQCGFKMFRGAAAIDLFGRLTRPGFIFDVELLYVAERLGYRVLEVPVNWHEVPGSKVRLIRDSWRMLIGLWEIRHRHALLTRSESALSATQSEPEPDR
jgi:dolichyl-phosphate beta-glucosyltransferase